MTKYLIIFNIFYTNYICYTNTQIIVLKTPDKSYHGRLQIELPWQQLQEMPQKL